MAGSSFSASTEFERERLGGGTGLYAASFQGIRAGTLTPNEGVAVSRVIGTSSHDCQVIWMLANDSCRMNAYLAGVLRDDRVVDEGYWGLERLCVDSDIVCRFPIGESDSY
jgi:hypothetical protein